jgi:hypothetical protein
MVVIDGAVRLLVAALGVEMTVRRDEAPLRDDSLGSAETRGGGPDGERDSSLGTVVARLRTDRVTEASDGDSLAGIGSLSNPNLDGTGMARGDSTIGAGLGVLASAGIGIAPAGGETSAGA